MLGVGSDAGFGTLGATLVLDGVFLGSSNGDEKSSLGGRAGHDGAAGFDGPLSSAEKPAGGGDVNSD